MGTGQRIKALTKEQGITLKELAEKSGVSYNTLYSITKRDSKRVQGDILQRLSTALNVSPSALLGTEVKMFDDVLKIIVNEYPNASFSPTDEPNSFRVSLGNKSRTALLRYFDTLNPIGQKLAVETVGAIAGNPDYRLEGSHIANSFQASSERVEELTKIPDYQKEKSPAEGD